MKRITLENCTDAQIVALFNLPALTDEQRTSIGQQLAGRLAPPTVAVAAVPVGMVRVEVTGNLYPAPKPEAGEMFVGYARRVTAGTQAFESMGALLVNTAAYGATADAKTWPGALDRFLHAEAYMTDAERAAQTNAAAEFGANMRQVADAGSVTQPPALEAGDIPIEN